LDWRNIKKFEDAVLPAYHLGWFHLVQAEVELWLAIAVDIEQHSCAWVEPSASSNDITDEVLL